MQKLFNAVGTFYIQCSYLSRLVFSEIFFSKNYLKKDQVSCSRELTFFVKYIHGRFVKETKLKKNLS